MKFGQNARIAPIVNLTVNIARQAHYYGQTMGHHPARALPDPILKKPVQLILHLPVHLASWED